MEHDQAAGELGTLVTIDASEARKRFRELLDQAYLGARRILISRHGKPAAVMIAIRDHEKLRKLDAEADRRLAAARDTVGESQSFRDFAERARYEAAPEPTPQPVMVGQLAAEIAEELVSRNPKVRRQTRDLAEEILERRYGGFHELSEGEANEAREYVLEYIAHNAVKSWMDASVPA